MGAAIALGGRGGVINGQLVKKINGQLVKTGRGLLIGG